jgi:murein DD-endopeptidase MepM/ murein hydrolase activator NlpD
VDGVRTRLLLVAVLFLALLVPAPALAEPPPAEPVAAFGWPLAGSPPVTRAFEPPLEPFGPGHRGVDLAAAPGAPVLAAGAGELAFSGKQPVRPL